MALLLLDWGIPFQKEVVNVVLGAQLLFFAGFFVALGAGMDVRIANSSTLKKSNGDQISLIELVSANPLLSFGTRTRVGPGALNMLRGSTIENCF